MPDRIEKQIFLRAPLHRVWRALSDSREFGTWFGVALPAGTFATGGQIRGPITHPGYEHLTWDATVERVEAPYLLSLRWHPNAVDASLDYDTEPTTRITFRLEEVEGGTRLTLTESGFDGIPESRRDQAYRGNDEGWTQQMHNIEQHVTGTA